LRGLMALYSRVSRAAHLGWPVFPWPTPPIVVQDTLILAMALGPRFNGTRPYPLCPLPPHCARPYLQVTMEFPRTLTVEALVCTSLPPLPQASPAMAHVGLWCPMHCRSSKNTPDCVDMTAPAITNQTTDAYIRPHAICTECHPEVGLERRGSMCMHLRCMWVSPVTKKMHSQKTALCPSQPTVRAGWPVLSLAHC
jgi:hypothetical protein